jgi:hypothetical protein
MTSGDDIDYLPSERPHRRRVRSSLLWAVSFALIGVSARAESPTRFDLVCSGTVTSWADSSSTSADWTTTARVDLTASRFCLDDCLDTRRVVADRSDRMESLVLGKESLSPERTEFVDKIDLDRRSGQYYRVHDWVETRGGYESEEFPIMHHDIYSGSCALAQFTGFPRRRY